jgi:ABC-type branched-subunit amino acid transport system substrate-binding protein
MVLANELCSERDSGIVFKLFDHQNQAGKLNELFQKGCMEDLDLMVGPVKSGLVHVMDSFASARSIPVINVLSHSTAGNYSGCMQFQQPGFEAIAQTCISKATDLGANGSAAIIFGGDRKDSLLAEAYRNQMIAQEKTVALFIRADTTNISEIATMLAAAGLNSKSQLFIVHNEVKIRNKLIGAYGKSRIRCPVFIYGNWLERLDVDFDDFCKFPFYFAAADLPVPEEEVDWTDRFMEKWKSPPGWVAWKGFDLVMMLTDQWYGSRKNAFDFSSVDLVSRVFGRYRYQSGKGENQYVPLYRLQKTGLTLLNP